ncbi:MAG: tRNA threonylcarbamoyladenosine dehydratase, partial [Lentisphaeria bacterium]|nr:tRNA threonylcarbamoyladenosine dehydratase [Lentisphaeria bacterium]
LAEAYKRSIKVIAAMGAGCRVDPTQIQYGDISKTYGCKLAKNVRSKLKKEYNITKGVMCVFSPEVNPDAIQPSENGERPIIGSSSFMPGIFGLFMAAKVINDLTK